MVPPNHSSANSEDNEAALQAGCDEILSKPVFLNTLAPVVHMIYRRHASPPATPTFTPATTTTTLPPAEH